MRTTRSDVPEELELEEGDRVVGELEPACGTAILEIVAPSVTGPLCTNLWSGICGDQRGKCFCGRHRASAEEEVEETFKAYTLYKKKADKVNPVDNAQTDGSTPEGDPHWRSKKWALIRDKLDPRHEFDKLITPKWSTMPRGERLTRKRWEELIKKDDVLRPGEKKLFLWLLLNREAALAWDWDHKQTLDPIVAPPQHIRTVMHKAWQVPNIPIPRALVPKVIELLQTRWDKGVIEESHALYRNPWFLVEKKDGSLWLINNAQPYNKYTIRDAFLPPGADEFSESVAECVLLSLVDAFSGYDQVSLDEKSRDITTFATPIGLFRMCTLPQGATNSVAQFMRIMVRVMSGLIPKVANVFLDDITVRGPVLWYEDEETLPGIRRAVLEHLQNLDKVLVNCELAGLTIAVAKSQWCKKKAVIVGYLTGSGGREPDQIKVEKIRRWPAITSLTQLRSFLGLVCVYRVWIPKYAHTAAPLHRLTRKNVVFLWTTEQEDAKIALIRAVTTAPILIAIDYRPGGGIIILTVDASITGWGAVLTQERSEGRLPCRFESGAWNNAESQYDATKRECRGVLCALKKLRCHLYGIHFVLETDAQVLVHQLKGSMFDLPGALINRWIAWVCMFDFEVRHIKGKDNVVADALLRLPVTEEAMRERDEAGDIDEFVDSQITLNELEEPLDPDQTWSEESQQIARYLHDFTMPDGLTGKKALRFRRRCTEYLLHERLLWKTLPGADQMRRVVDGAEKRQELVEAAHKENGHRGREATYGRLRQRYYWPGMYTEVVRAVVACPDCQAWAPRRYQEAAQGTTPPPWPMWKVHLDSQHMPTDRGKRYLIEGRCDLTGWPEATAVRRLDSKAVKDFIWDKLIWTHGMPGLLIVDGGPEFKKEVKTVCEELGIRRIVVSAYNPRANGIVEGGHFSLASTLAKLTNGTGKGWTKLQGPALFAERTTIRASHGQTPFHLVRGYEPVVPLETSTPSWRVINWSVDMSTQEHLEARIRMLEGRQEDLNKAAADTAKYRRRLADQRNSTLKNSMRPKNREIKERDLVLLYDNVRAINMSRDKKLSYRWKGPYFVRRRTDQGVYFLRTPDGVDLEGTFPPHRLKKFIQTDGYWRPVDETYPESTPSEDLIRPTQREEEERSERSSGSEVDTGPGEDSGTGEESEEETDSEEDADQEEESARSDDSDGSEEQDGLPRPYTSIPMIDIPSYPLRAPWD